MPKVCPPVVKLSTEDMLEELSVNFVMEGNKRVYMPIDQYWLNIFNDSSSYESKYPTIQKVVKFAISIKGLIITKSYLQSVGSCKNFNGW